MFIGILSYNGRYIAIVGELGIILLDLKFLSILIKIHILKLQITLLQITNYSILAIPIQRTQKNQDIMHY